MRNPLGVIRGFCGVLEEELAEAGHAALAQEVKVLGDTAAQLSQLVDQQLNFSQLQDGRSDSGRLGQSVPPRAHEMLAVARWRMRVSSRTWRSSASAGGLLREHVSAWLAAPNGMAEPPPVVMAESGTLLSHHAEAGTNTVFFTPAQPLDAGRVLVVDDNESNRLLLARRLARQGYTITPAVDGREALALLRGDELLHVLLPYHIAAELKATQRVKPRRHEEVAVLCCDIVDFTGFCDRQPPEAVLECLQWHMTALERIRVANTWSAPWRGGFPGRLADDYCCLAAWLARCQASGVRCLTSPVLVRPSLGSTASR